MVAANLRLVLHWARRYQDRGVELDRSRPGGDVRPDEGRRQVRLGTRLPVLHLRHLVDPTGPAAGRAAARPDHPCAHGGGGAEPTGRRRCGSSPTSSSGAPTDEEMDDATGIGRRPLATRPGWPGWWPAWTSRRPPTRRPPSGTWCHRPPATSRTRSASEIALDRVRQAVDRLADLQRQGHPPPLRVRRRRPRRCRPPRRDSGIGVRRCARPRRRPSRCSVTAKPSRRPTRPPESRGLVRVAARASSARLTGGPARVSRPGAPSCRPGRREVRSRGTSAPRIPGVKASGRRGGGPGDESPGEGPPRP